MSHMAQDKSGNVEAHESDFGELLSALMAVNSDSSLNLSVVNDQAQLRVIFTPKNMPFEEAEGVVESNVETALEGAATTQEYEVDVFPNAEDEEYIAVFTPKE